MDPLLHEHICRACERLSVSYAVYLDTQRYDAFAALFGAQGVLAVAGRVAGQAAIAKAMERRPAELRSRHVLTNILIEPIHDTRATGITYLSLYRHIGAASLLEKPIEGFTPAAIGHYADELELTPDGWRFAHRELHLAFKNSDNF
ncbi:MAG: hypothetical protein GWP70_05570 [Proteobacteria bacterium]|nr:hypothetical protein [Pseudomonadota bacterium]